ncbi:spermatogenesis-associated protein 48 isoform X2 [Ornithorhynchus anatinus]|uniref:spermatogenesis-associated protein 48 isoform X2 n=1 Tax=Ornithorhynchus anatinus TaxID=9258 RepID=UPI0010A8DD7C|nr:spermatogenesis-associated protein 48 isoform X2 [Ornithorhynchus anatinus]
MPSVRGPENRHNYGSFEEKGSPAFLKFHPHSSPLAPHRDDSPLGDPCSGFLSAGGRAELEAEVDRPVPTPGELDKLKAQLRIPPPDDSLWKVRREAKLMEELKRSRLWNSRAVSDAALRARLGGWTSSSRVTPAPGRHEDSVLTNKKLPKRDLALEDSDEPSSVEQAADRARGFIYKSSTQKSYEDVPWDKILLPKLRPPVSTVEKKADLVSHCFTVGRYERMPEISQIVGGLWDRFQTRHFTSAAKPINFVSPSSRTRYIPLYTGCVESLSADDIDNPYGDISSLGKPRSSKPRFTTSSYTPHIPGYMGKVHFTATHPENSNLPSTTPSTIPERHQPVKRNNLGESIY